MQRGNYSIQTQNATFEHERTVHPLDMLISNLVAEIDDEIYQTLKQRSRSKLSSEEFDMVTDSLSLFFTLRKSRTEEEFVFFLTSLMGNTCFHGDCGKFKCF